LSLFDHPLCLLSGHPSSLGRHLLWISFQLDQI
jgi:hypothetical protein